MENVNEEFLKQHGLKRKSKRVNLESCIDGLTVMGLPITRLDKEHVYEKDFDGQPSEFQGVLFETGDRRIALVVQDGTYVSFVPSSDSKDLEDDERAFLFWAVSSSIFFTTDSMFIPQLVVRAPVPVEKEPLDDPGQIVVQHRDSQLCRGQHFTGTRSLPEPPFCGRSFRRSADRVLHRWEVQRRSVQEGRSGRQAWSVSTFEERITVFERKDGDLEELLSPHGQTSCTVCENGIVHWAGVRDVWPFMCPDCEKNFVETLDKKIEVIDECQALEEEDEKFKPRYGIVTRNDAQYSLVPGIPVLDICLSVIMHQRDVWTVTAHYSDSKSKLLGTYFDKHTADAHAKWHGDIEKEKCAKDTTWLRNDVKGFREKVFQLPNGEEYRIGSKINRYFDHEAAEVEIALAKLTPRERKLLKGIK